MISSRGAKAPGSGKCDKCHVYHIDNWIYKYSDGSEIKLCRFCKDIALDKAKKRKKTYLITVSVVLLLLENGVNLK